MEKPWIYRQQSKKLNTGVEKRLSAERIANRSIAHPPRPQLARAPSLLPQHTLRHLGKGLEMTMRGGREGKGADGEAPILEHVIPEIIR